MANLNLNKVILGGRLTARPELKQSPTGASVVQFNLAVGRRAAKDKPRETDYIPCVAWRERAEFLCRFFDKGSSVCVVGSLQVRTWSDAHGAKRTSAEVLVDEILFVDSKSETQGAIFTEPTDAAPELSEPTFTDDVPF